MFKKICTVFAMSLALLLALAATSLAANPPKLVAVTFDDGPSKYTSQLLDELDKRNVQVTFFMTGRNAQAYKSTVQRAYEAGHQIASHTYNHPQLTKLNSATVKSQASRTTDILNSAISPAGSYMLRPPYGSYNARVLNDINTPAILWSVDTRDWESRNADAVYSHIVNDTKDGSIILMHDLYPTTIEGAIRGIDYLRSQGYELVTVKELLRRRGVTPAAGSTYSSAPNNGVNLPGIAAPKITTSYVGTQAYIDVTADPGAKIYYTVDYTGSGQTPTSQSAVYTAPLQLEGTATIQAFAAYDLNGARGPIATAKVQRPRTPAPTFLLENNLASINAPDGAQIYYILDDTLSNSLKDTTPANITAGTAATLYTKPLLLNPGSCLAAAAIQPDHLLSETVTLVYSPLGNVFYDMHPSHWCFADADQVVASGLLTTANGLFRPNDIVRRGDLAEVLYRQAGSPEVQTASDNTPAVQSVQWAVEQGFINGYPDGTLQLNAPITREQLAVILQRGMADKLPQPEEAHAQLADFADAADVMAYAKEATEWTLAHGIFKGDTAGRLNPSATLTRAELASILLRCR